MYIDNTFDAYVEKYTYNKNVCTWHTDLLYKIGFKKKSNTRKKEMNKKVKQDQTDILRSDDWMTDWMIDKCNN